VSPVACVAANFQGQVRGLEHFCRVERGRAGQNQCRSVRYTVLTSRSWASIADILSSHVTQDYVLCLVSVSWLASPSMAGSNRTRAVDALLTRTESQPASFTVHLYPEHWVLNNGSKFLYHNQTAVSPVPSCHINYLLTSPNSASSTTFAPTVFLSTFLTCLMLQRSPSMMVCLACLTTFFVYCSSYCRLYDC
jgi:hypothetical protein